MSIFRSAVDGSDRRLDCPRARPITSPCAARSICATNCKRVAELEQILASVNVVDPPDPASNSVAFGATVTVKDKKGRTETYTIVGVDELDLEQGTVSWISPIGKALLAADMGDWITLEDGRAAKIVKIESKSDTWRMARVKTVESY